MKRGVLKARQLSYNLILTILILLLIGHMTFIICH